MAKFFCATNASGSTTFAEIVVVIPRMRALMSLGSGGMPRYAAAGVAADKA